MRGSKPAGFSGVGEGAARSLDRVSRRRGPRRAAGASLEQRDFTFYKGGGNTHGTIRLELGARGMRGSKPAGFSGVGERAARSQVQPATPRANNLVKRQNDR